MSNVIWLIIFVPIDSESEHQFNRSNTSVLGHDVPRFKDTASAMKDHLFNVICMQPTAISRDHRSPVGGATGLASCQVRFCVVQDPSRMYLSGILIDESECEVNVHETAVLSDLDWDDLDRNVGEFECDARDVFDHCR